MKNQFYRLPADMAEEHGVTIASVYAFLLDACEEDEFRADRKVETIAKKLKMTTRAVIYTINKLEELGYVHRVKIGRRTVYDLVQVLPPKKGNEDYFPEDYRQLGDTYDDMLRRIPNLTIRRQYQEILEKHNYSLDSEALFTLRSIAYLDKEEKNTELWEKRLEKSLTEQERIIEAGAMTKFTDYSEDEQEEFAGQLAFDD